MWYCVKAETSSEHWAETMETAIAQVNVLRDLGHQDITVVYLNKLSNVRTLTFNRSTK